MSNSPEKEPVSKFDLNREVSSHYFKSSFARSMFSGSNQSKSLDFVYFDNNTIDEENENDSKTPTEEKAQPGCTSPLTRGFATKAFEQRFDADSWKFNSGRNQNNNAITFWKRKQFEAGSRSRDQNVAQVDEILTLRQECQRLAEDNQRLHQAMDPAVSLQVQVDTLQWQLKQAESSRQMYRAVLEQVSKFLERVYTNLDQVNGKPPPSKCKTRVPRSRSVHTVIGHSHSRPVSPSPSGLQSSVHRANSISQIQDSHSHSHTLLRDLSWRLSNTVEEVPPERLSQEAFRLLRTVQSLLGTREPDLTHRLVPTPTSTPTPDNSWCMGSLSSLTVGQRKSLDASSSSAEGECEGEVESGSGGTPQLSVGSAEDESGFSSMSSFHEVGLPEVGLPLVPRHHRRWSSTPAPTHVPDPQTVHVLWV